MQSVEINSLTAGNKYEGNNAQASINSNLNKKESIMSIKRNTKVLKDSAQRQLEQKGGNTTHLSPLI